MVDLNHNGMSDVWELTFGASGLDPNADTDGDGVINRLEAFAATDPFDPTSYPAISFGTYQGTNFTVTLPSALGKQYTLLSAPSMDSLSSTNWFAETNVVARSGTSVTLTAPVGPTVKFFRIAISDVDTDGDGVNDWEEYQLGLDPLNPVSNGQMDSNGKALNDYQYVVGKMASQNSITITATDSVAVEPDPGQNSTSPGQFAITRGGFPLNTVTVNLAMGGPGPGFAIPGVDHQPFGNTVTFGPGVSTVLFNLTPLANPALFSSVVAQLKLMPGSGYSVSSSNSASVVIYPSQTASGTGLTGLYFTNSSSTYTNAANFNPTNLVMTRADPMISFVWGNSTNPIPNAGNYCVRWVGQIEPQYSETYYFDANTAAGVKLWVNDQLIINNWVNKGASDSLGTIALQGGTRYDIRMEYFHVSGSASATLSWYSPANPSKSSPRTAFFRPMRLRRPRPLRVR